MQLFYLQCRYACSSHDFLVFEYVTCGEHCRRLFISNPKSHTQLLLLCQLNSTMIIKIIKLLLLWCWMTFHRIIETAYLFETGRDATRSHLCWRFVTIDFVFNFSCRLRYDVFLSDNVLMLLFSFIFRFEFLRLLLSVLRVWLSDWRKARIARARVCVKDVTFTQLATTLT